MNRRQFLAGTAALLVACMIPMPAAAQLPIPPSPIKTKTLALSGHKRRGLNLLLLHKPDGWYYGYRSEPLQIDWICSGFYPTREDAWADRANVGRMRHYVENFGSFISERG